MVIDARTKAAHHERQKNEIFTVNVFNRDRKRVRSGSIEVQLVRAVRIYRSRFTPATRLFLRYCLHGGAVRFGVVRLRSHAPL
jgi:hypothetical protein